MRYPDSKNVQKKCETICKILDLTALLLKVQAICNSTTCPSVSS
jgi:hypothetical protein